MAKPYVDNRPDQTLEDVDAKEHRAKSSRAASKAGNWRNKGATLAKVAHHSYQAELLERGVKDSQGNHTPIVGKSDESKQQPLHHTKLLNVGDDDPNVKTGNEVHARSYAFR